MIGTVLETCSSQPRLGCPYFRHIFTERMNSVIHVSINQLLESFLNYFGVLSWLCQVKG
jgi:hypothetical protein